MTLDLISIAIHFGVWTVTTFLFEFVPFQSCNMLPLITSKLLKRKTNVSVLQSAEYIDDDVATEEKRVVEKSKDELQVRVSMFNKVYIQRFNSTVAVKQASFGLQYGECFALLGVNGAGKTTTFKCLTNEVKPTGG